MHNGHSIIDETTSIKSTFFSCFEAIVFKNCIPIDANDVMYSKGFPGFIRHD